MLLTYWNLLLGQDNSAVLAPDANGHDVGGCDGLEGIFCRTSLCQSLSYSDATSPHFQFSQLFDSFLSLVPPRLLPSFSPFPSLSAMALVHTDLVQSSLVGENGNVSVVTSVACASSVSQDQSGARSSPDSVAAGNRRTRHPDRCELMKALLKDCMSGWEEDESVDAQCQKIG